MIPLFTTVSRLLLEAGGAKSRREAVTKLLKQQLDPDHGSLTRDVRHTIPLARAQAGESTEFRSSEDGAGDEAGAGEGKGESKGPAWREFIWPQEQTLGDSTWSDIHWRFYDNGLIAFHATMKNASEGMDVGDMQGHRIELRTRDGLVVGAWTAAFFVRRATAVTSYPANTKDENPLLLQHFDELDERQSGHWYYDR